LQDVVLVEITKLHDLSRTIGYSHLEFNILTAAEYLLSLEN